MIIVISKSELRYTKGKTRFGCHNMYDWYNKKFEIDKSITYLQSRAYPYKSIREIYSNICKNFKINKKTPTKGLNMCTLTIVPK